MIKETIKYIAKDVCFAVEKIKRSGWGVTMTRRIFDKEHQVCLDHGGVRAPESVLTSARRPHYLPRDYVDSLLREAFLGEVFESLGVALSSEGSFECFRSEEAEKAALSRTTQVDIKTNLRRSKEQLEAIRDTTPEKEEREAQKFQIAKAEADKLRAQADAIEASAKVIRDTAVEQARSERKTPEELERLRFSTRATIRETELLLKRRKLLKRHKLLARARSSRKKAKSSAKRAAKKARTSDADDTSSD